MADSYDNHADGEDKTGSSGWGLIFRRIVSVIVVVFVVPALIRNCSHEDALRALNADLDRQQGRYDSAIEEFTAQLKADPNSASLHSKRGDSYRGHGDLDLAFADLDQAIRLDPKLWDAWFSRCLAWRQKGDTERALADCREAARLRPDDPEPTAMVGRLLIDRGDLDAARRMLDAAVALQPDGSGVLDNRFYRGQLGLFYQNLPADAANDFSKALARSFDYVDTARILGGGDTPMMGARHPFEPDGYYLIMWQHIARARAGQADTWEFDDNVKKLVTALKGNQLLNIPGQPGPSEDAVLAEVLRPWPGRFIALYLGKIRPETIRPAAESAKDPDTRRRWVCDVDFYLGIEASLKGAGENARKLLRAAADGCPASVPEAGFAKAELKRLGS